ncbi:MAG: tetratricopeptide repeat protein, partial [Patescibacteria group bacterium]|nr:tetratricopeptide repeat protein [Patescibacteria group bacterium]
GDTHVRLIDVKLEQQFDLPSAAAHAKAAADWLANVGPNVAGTRRVPFASGPVPSDLGPPPASDATESVPVALKDGTRRVPSTLLPDDLFPASLPSLDQTSYAIYLRAGLVAYLSERPTEAVEWFERAKPFEPERSFIVVHGEIPTGIERLIAAARTGKSLTPEEARRGDEKARLILMLADVYHEAEQWEKSLGLCTRVIDGAAPKASGEQKSYAHFRRGRNCYCLAGEARDTSAALSDYVASVQVAPRTDWADKAMFLAGNIYWNHNSDADTAVAVWRRFLHDYPDSKDGDRAAMYIGAIYLWSDRPEQAVKAFNEYLEQRPGARFTRTVRELLSQAEERINEKPGGGRPRRQ